MIKTGSDTFDFVSPILCPAPGYERRGEILKKKKDTCRHDRGLAQLVGGAWDGPFGVPDMIAALCFDMYTMRDRVIEEE
jgi:hypothetical protein